MEVSNVQHQVMANHPLEDVLGCSKPQQQQQEKRLRPHPEPALKCPRCDSTNTKFCYYNNYSLSQPRYFCKGCRRYWTQGGSLRNVPVGGGCRKNKRSSSKKSQDQTLLANPNPLLPTIPPPPCISYGPSDLSLAFTGLHRPPTTKQLGLNGHENFLLTNCNPNPSISHMTCSAQTPGFLDILGSGLLDSTNTSNFHSLYYGFGGGEVEGGGEDVAVPFEGGLGGGATISSSTATAPTSQGSCGAMGGEENKVVVGLQWHSDGEERRGADRGRNYWTGVASSSSSWPGLINSPLMYR